jgi:UDP-N-acetylmuramyl pentapeptide phosphotransferase/UDP-N-acetylglucosamine-1-phosphate transferase
MVIIAAGVSGILCWLVTYGIRSLAPLLGFVDIPNERSSHQNPTARGGGVAFVISTSLITFAAADWANLAILPGTSSLFCGAVIIAAVSLADDRWHLPILVRFSAHVIGALILISGVGWMDSFRSPWGGGIPLGWWGLPLALLWIVGLTNAFNFMDGIDGLAAGQAAMTTAVMAWLAFLRNNDFVLWAMAIMAGSVLGFLMHNWPPARIFMGDVGSAFLGFMFAGWAIVAGGENPEPLPFFAWAVMLAPFLLDTIVTLAIRIVHKKRWYEAHREHIYQRLVRNGWSHRAVTGLYLAVSAFLGLSTVMFYGYNMFAKSIYIVLIISPLVLLYLVSQVVNSRHNYPSAQ